MIHRLVSTWKRTNHLLDFSYDEVLSVAYLEAARILEERFDPERGTASTYLSRYLFGYVQYRLIRDTGKRKTRKGWVHPSRRDPPSRHREVDSALLVELEELIAGMHPDLQDIARRLAAGDDLEAIVAESFDTSTGATLEDSTEELRRLFHRVLLRIHDDPSST